jgi:hypothetical protein
MFVFPEVFRRPSLRCLMFPKVLFWDLCCSVYASMIYVVQLNITVFVFLLTIYKFFVMLLLLMTAFFCSEMLTLCKTGIPVTI